MSADKETFADLIDLPEENAQEIDFAKAVGKVDKLKQDTIVKTTALMDKELSHIKREAAERYNKQEYDDHVSSAFVPIVDPNEVLSWKTPGAQPYLLRKLKNGEYREADFIDLHGKTIDEAYEIVRAFIRQTGRISLCPDNSRQRQPSGKKSANEKLCRPLVKTNERRYCLSQCP